jgi:hypothetical protein
MKAYNDANKVISKNPLSLWERARARVVNA